MLMAKIGTFDVLSEAKGFKLAHLIIRSIVKKMDQVRLLLQGSNIDVFSVSESWLRPLLYTQLVDLDGYKTFRLDRPSCPRRQTRGGVVS